MAMTSHEILWTSSRPLVGGGSVQLSMEVFDGVIYRFALDGVTIGFTMNGDFIAPWDRAVRAAVACGGDVAAQCRFTEFDLL